MEFGLLIFYRFEAENRIGWKVALSFNLRLNMDRVHFRCPVRQKDYLALEKVCAMLMHFLRVFCHLNYRVCTEYIFVCLHACLTSLKLTFR